MPRRRPTTTSATRSSQTAEAAVAPQGRTDSACTGSTSRSGRSLYTSLVGDEITSVDVVIAGQTYAARMGENAFGIRVEGAKPSELDTVVLHRRDGTANNIGLASARPNDG
jgi:hypothetical protein